CHMNRYNQIFFLAGLCFSVAQTDEEMLTQVVGEPVTFPFSIDSGGSVLYNHVIIAEVVKGTMDPYEGSFKDRIQWDQQTGQFTIKDLTTSDSGMYVVYKQGAVWTSYQLTVFGKASTTSTRWAVPVCSCRWLRQQRAQLSHLGSKSNSFHFCLFSSILNLISNVSYNIFTKCLILSVFPYTVFYCLEIKEHYVFVPLFTWYID
uniref:Immunoglobulin V-set domain-containing protein n=1 Tax=Esox lucius TaxID=8010 RepID=A0AAY5K8I2_ESOLU